MKTGFILFQEDCHNYIRILAKQNDKDLLICGTNSYMPKCRKYKFQVWILFSNRIRLAPVSCLVFSQNNTFVFDGSEFSGTGVCPYDPGHNSTAYYSKDRNELYAGTVADFAGTDSLVSRRQMDEPDDLGLRTERSDTKCLNGKFVFHLTLICVCKYKSFFRSKFCFIIRW